MDGAEGRFSGKTVVSLGIACLLLGLIALGTLAVTTHRSMVNETRRANPDAQITVASHNAHLWTGREEALERSYLLKPSARLLALRAAAARHVAADLHSVTTLNAEALRRSSSLRNRDSTAFEVGFGAIVLALLLTGGLGVLIGRQRRTKSAMLAGEVERLSRLAATDPLTELPNHRAFHEDLAEEMQRTARTGIPISLVMLDLNDLKAVNNAHGHQAGDEQLRALAEAITATQRATDRAYRIGGDEFAVILPATREWAAFKFAQRVRDTLERREEGVVHETAGISQALTFRPKDDLVHEADLALISAKRSQQDVAVYTAEMEPGRHTAPAIEDEHHTRTLAGALALAVDAKDAYTRSHCQTVSTLCAVIETELGFSPEEVGRIRLAGLLHDVGKIGIPDAILKKPAELTAKEYEQMKTHSLLGYDIVQAADMPIEALWVLHHHERIDGRGYPDGLAGQDIPLQSRIIHVADAFEAMTSDRPYRTAPGQRFAVEELRRNVDSQFDARVVAALLRVLDDRAAGDHNPPPAVVGA
jgi:diguanylate cyclase (GGDEF)-like protein